MKNVSILISIFLGLPLISSAQTVDVSFFVSLLEGVSELISAAIPIVIGLAVLLFLWGLTRYILNQDDPEGRAGARHIMIWGIVIIFVMVSLWGLVDLLGNLFGITPGQSIELPELQL